MTHALHTDIGTSQPCGRSVAQCCSGCSRCALAGCETTTSSGAVGVNRSQLMLISAEQLDQMAAQTYTKLSNDAAAKGDLNPDPAMTKRVRAIAARIEPQTKVFRPDARELAVAGQRHQEQRAERVLHAGRPHHVLFGIDHAARSHRRRDRDRDGSRDRARAARALARAGVAADRGANRSRRRRGDTGRRRRRRRSRRAGLSDAGCDEVQPHRREAKPI